MKRVNSNKVTNGAKRTPTLSSPSGQPSGSKNMPRVGGLTTNVSPSLGAKGGAR